MPKPKKYPVVAIEHLDTMEMVYCWGHTSGVEMISSCLSRGEAIEVNTIRMTEEEFDAMEDYTGDC